MKRTLIHMALFVLVAVLTGTLCGQAPEKDSLSPGNEVVLEGGDGFLPGSLPEEQSDSSILSGDSAIAAAYRMAGDLYNQGAFEKALTEYRRIVKSGFEAADLYYNMGNAAFRSNSIGYAVLYYEKALKLDPSHEDAANNLAYVSRYTIDSFDEVPELFIRTWISAAVQAFSERTWSLLALILFTVSVISVLVYLFTRNLGLKKTGFFSALFGLILFIFAILSAIARHNDIVEPASGIVISPSVLVRSTPSESGNELFVLHEGARVEMKEEVAGWQNIRIVDGREGWIRSGDFAHI
jgi:hypothetical protein